jgi:hypothetical protein
MLTYAYAISNLGSSLPGWISLLSLSLSEEGVERRAGTILTMAEEEAEEK